MNLMMLLEMAAAGHGDRIAWQTEDKAISYSDLKARAMAGADIIRSSAAQHLIYVGDMGPEFPIALFSAACAGVPLVPLNYRSSSDQLADLIEAHHPAVLIADDVEFRARGHSQLSLTQDEWFEATTARSTDGQAWPEDDSSTALLLYTSGTTSTPKAAVLRHRHLVSYVLGTVEFGSADPDDVSLVSVPPYHIAGVSNVLSNVYSGRRVCALRSFSPEGWLDTARRQKVTHALLVPTMLARIVDHLDEGTPSPVSTLRSLAYGGSRMPATVIERALRLFPDTGFVNAYGLTETSSTIAVLGPEDHREALNSLDPTVRARLSSAGRTIPEIEIQIRDQDGVVVPAGHRGELWVRGPQVSGEYLGVKSGLDQQGWFQTRDQGWLDDGGFLFIEGRTDDTIIRGGENIAAAEIEDVLLRHPAVMAAAVVGVPDDEWGHRICAAVVVRPGHEQTVTESALKDFVRNTLRSAKTPDAVRLLAELPYTSTGKLLRRQVLESFQKGPDPSVSAHAPSTYAATSHV